MPNIRRMSKPLNSCEFSYDKWLTVLDATRSDSGDGCDNDSANAAWLSVFMS